RLAAEDHEVHLYACCWDSRALPNSLHYHPLPKPRGPRFLRPWRFAASCAKALRDDPGAISIGFNKTWGQDIQYPLGGAHVASAAYNIHKHPTRWQRWAAGLIKRLDLAHWSFSLLERRQYLGAPRPLVVVNSNLVRHHFQSYYQMNAGDVRVV